MERVIEGAERDAGAGNHGAGNHGTGNHGTGNHGTGNHGAGERETAPERRVIEGVVAHGQRLGRELGFPTANLPVPVDFPLSDGVYRSRAEVDGRCYDGMSNLGCNPTVGGGERRLETHLFDFSGELYGRRLSVELLEKIRDERKFATVEELRMQIAGDKAAVLRLLDK